jgi:sugar phosphate isomerase/epimerase
MKVSCTSWSFPLCTLEEAAGIARALGFAALDVGAYPGGHLDRAAILGDRAAELRRVRGLGMVVANIYWTFGAGFAERALTSPEPAIRRQNLDDFQRVVEFCHEAGVPSLMVLPGILHPGQTRAAALDLCAEACRALLAISRPAGVALALEPHVMGLLESPADTLKLLAEARGARLALDYAHFITAGYPQAAIDPLCEHAAHVHLRQAKPGFLQTRLEHGTLNFPAILDALRGAGYDGYLAVEYVHQDYLQTDNVDVVSETVKMRKLLAAYL